MEITQAAPNGTALSPLNGDWMLLRDAASGRFVRRFAFVLPTGGLAESIRWQSNTGFTLSLPILDYDALAAGAPDSVTTTNSVSDGVELTFLVPRALWRVKISGAQLGDVIEAHRVDGDIVTKDAFAHASHETAGAILNVSDRRLVLKQKRGGAGVALRSGNIAEVVLRSAAANVRVGIVLPGLGGEVFYLRPEAGTVLSNPATASNLGPSLASLLQGACDRLTDSLGSTLLPALVPMTLVLESDTPTRAHISGFVLRYRLHRQRFEDLASKRVFAFAGGSLTSRELTIDVPHGATLWSATLSMMGPFQEAAEEASENGGGVGALPTMPPPTMPLPTASELGVELHTGEAAATRIMLSRAALVQGAAIELVALAEASAGRVRLHQDAAGRPGEALREASFALLHGGVRRVARVDFDRTGVMSAGPIWLALQCDSGALLWFTNEPSDATAGSQMLRRAASDIEWTAIGAASNRGAAASFVTASGAENIASPAGAPAFHGVRLHLGAVRLHGLSPSAGSAGNKETRFDVAAAIQPSFQSGSPGALSTVSFSLVSSEPGRVTVYPPELEFDP